MVVYNYSGKEIHAKIVYYGPALSGKTTNLEWIYSKIPLEYSGKMISLKTQADRTIFFDFLPLELGKVDGFRTRFMLYTVPGQVQYNATRKMVLKGVDGVVFVADSEVGRMEDNRDSLQNLKENLTEIGLDLDSIPLVLQYNKRDLVNCVSVEELEATLNPSGRPSFCASALTGEGVYETLHKISQMIFLKLTTGEQDSAQAGASGGMGETSLFGDEIAARLKEIDRPASPEEATELGPMEGLEGVGPASPGPDSNQQIDAILDVVEGSPPPPPPAPRPDAVMAEPVLEGSEAAGSRSETDAEKDEEQELVSELVDHVLSPSDDTPSAPPQPEAPAAPVEEAPVAQAPAAQPPHVAPAGAGGEGDSPSNAGYGQRFDRMIQLDESGPNPSGPTLPRPAISRPAGDEFVEARSEAHEAPTATQEREVVTLQIPVELDADTIERATSVRIILDVHVRR